MLGQHLWEIPLKDFFNSPKRFVPVNRSRTMHTLQVMDTPDFPDRFKPLARNMGAAFDTLRVRKDVKWTYLSPAGNFVADDLRTGKYTAGGEEILVNSKGKSEISYADYAIAMIDEAENGKHIQMRFTVVSE